MTTMDWTMKNHNGDAAAEDVPKKAKQAAYTKLLSNRQVRNTAQQEIGNETPGTSVFQAHAWYSGTD